MDGIEFIILIGIVVLAVIGMFVTFRIGYSYRKKVAELRISSAEEEAKKIIENAKSKAVKDAEHAKKERLLEAKEEIHRERNELDKETQLTKRLRFLKRKKNRFKTKLLKLTNSKKRLKRLKSFSFHSLKSLLNFLWQRQRICFSNRLKSTQGTMQHCL